MVFLARLYGIHEREAVAYAADFAELGAYFYMPLGTYSSGMRARLAFGACLAVPFNVYLIDEVTSVSDGRFRAKCLKAFRQRMDNADVIMVSHDYETMRAYATKAQYPQRGAHRVAILKMPLTTMPQSCGADPSGPRRHHGQQYADARNRNL